MRKSLITILLPAAAMLANVPLSAAAGLRCEARLSPAQEVGDMQVRSAASGRLVARFDAAFNEVDVRLRVRGAPGANRAHFHCARAGANGPVAFGLVAPGPFGFDGGVVRGTLINDDATGADCEASIDRPVGNIAALAFAMRDGLVYINVHTPDHPGGEIRGQMSCGGNDTRGRDHGSHDRDDDKSDDDKSDDDKNDDKSDDDSK